MNEQCLYHIEITDLKCPYCDYAHDVPHERMDYKKELETQFVKCVKCKKQFKASVDFSPRFTTEAIESDEEIIK